MAITSPECKQPAAYETATPIREADLAELNPFLRPVLLRRNRDAWEFAASGGNTDWLPLEGSRDMTAPEAIVLACERFEHVVRHVVEADVH